MSMLQTYPSRFWAISGLSEPRFPGAFRAADALIVESSVPLLPGTLVRLGDARTSRGVEGTAPSPNLGGVESGNHRARNLTRPNRWCGPRAAATIRLGIKSAESRYLVALWADQHRSVLERPR